MAFGGAWEELSGQKSQEDPGNFSAGRKVPEVDPVDAILSKHGPAAADPADAILQQYGKPVANVTLQPTQEARNEKGLAPVDNEIVTLGGKIKGTYNSATALRRAIDDYKQLYGRDVPVISGYRSNAEQAALYNQLHGISPVAPPGASHHNHGSAYDLGLQGKELDDFLKHVGKYGFAQSVTNDPNHITYQPEIPTGSSERKWLDDDPRMLAALGKHAKPGSPQQLLQGMAKSRGFTNEDAGIMNNQIMAESAFNPKVGRSSAGAIGLPQFMPGTLAPYLDKRGIQLRDYLDNPSTQYDIYFEHIQGLLKTYKGNWARALAAYNAGPGAEDHFQNVAKRITMPETRNYVAKILGVSPEEADAMVVNGTGPNLSSVGPTVDKIQSNQNMFSKAARNAAASFDIDIAGPESGESTDAITQQGAGAGNALGQGLQTAALTHPGVRGRDIIKNDIKEMGKMALSGVLSGVAGIGEWLQAEDRNFGETMLKATLQHPENPYFGLNQRLFPNRTHDEVVKAGTKAVWGTLAAAAAPSDWFDPEYAHLNEMRHGKDFEGWLGDKVSKIFNVFSPEWSPSLGLSGLVNPQALEANASSLAMSVPLLAGAMGSMHAMAPALMTKNAAGQLVLSQTGSTLGAPGEYLFKRMMNSPMLQAFASHLGPEWMQQMALTTSLGAGQMMSQAVGDTLHAGGSVQDAAKAGLKGAIGGSLFGLLFHLGVPLKASAKAATQGMASPTGGPPVGSGPKFTPPSANAEAIAGMSPYLKRGREMLNNPNSKFNMALEGSLSDIFKTSDKASNGYFSANIVKSAQVMFRTQMDIARQQATDRVVGAFTSQADHIDRAAQTSMDWLKQGMAARDLAEKTVKAHQAAFEDQMKGLAGPVVGSDGLPVPGPYADAMATPEGMSALALAKESFQMARENQLPRSAMLADQAEKAAKAAKIPFSIKDKAGGTHNIQNLARAADQLEVSTKKLADVKQAIPDDVQIRAQELSVIFSHVSQSLRRKAAGVAEVPETTAVAGGPLADPTHVTTLDQMNAVIDKALHDYGGLATPFQTQLEQEAMQAISTMLEYGGHQDSPQTAIAGIVRSVQAQIDQLIENKPVQPLRPSPGNEIIADTPQEAKFRAKKEALYKQAMVDWNKQMAEYNKQITGQKMIAWRKQLDILNGFNSKVNPAPTTKPGIESKFATPIEDSINAKIKDAGIHGGSEQLLNMHTPPKLSADDASWSYVNNSWEARKKLKPLVTAEWKAAGSPGQGGGKAAVFAARDAIRDTVVKDKVLAERPEEIHRPVKADMDQAYEKGVGYVKVDVPWEWIADPGKLEMNAGVYPGEEPGGPGAMKLSKYAKGRAKNLDPNSLKIDRAFLKHPLFLGHPPATEGNLAGWAAEVVKRSDAKIGWNPNMDPKDVVKLPGLPERYVLRKSFEADPSKFKSRTSEPFQHSSGFGWEKEHSGKDFGFTDSADAPSSPDKLTVLDGKIRYLNHFLDHGPGAKETTMPAYVREDTWNEMLKTKLGAEANGPGSPTIHEVAMAAAGEINPQSKNIVGNFALQSARDFLKSLGPDEYRQIALNQLKQQSAAMAGALEPSAALQKKIQLERWQQQREAQIAGEAHAHGFGPFEGLLKKDSSGATVGINGGSVVTPNVDNIYRYEPALQMLLNQSVALQGAMDTWVKYNSGGIGLADRLSRSWSALADWRHIPDAGRVMSTHISAQMRAALENNISQIAPQLKFRSGRGWESLQEMPTKNGQKFGERFVDAVESMHRDQKQMQTFLAEYPQMRDTLAPYFGLSAALERFQTASPDMKGLFNLINTRHRFPWLREVGAFSADSSGTPMYHHLASENAREIPTLKECRDLSKAAEEAIDKGDWSRDSDPKTQEGRYKAFVQATQGRRMQILGTTDGAAVNNTLANLLLRKPLLDPIEMIKGQIESVLEASATRHLILQMMHSPVPGADLIADGSRPVSMVERFSKREVPVMDKDGLQVRDPKTGTPITRQESSSPPIVRSLYTGTTQSTPGENGIRAGGLAKAYVPLTGKEFGMGRHDKLMVGGEEVPVGELHAHPDFAYLLNNFFATGDINPTVMQHVNNLTRTGQLFLGALDHLANVWGSHYYKTMGFAADHIANSTHDMTTSAGHILATGMDGTLGTRSSLGRLERAKESIGQMGSDLGKAAGAAKDSVSAMLDHMIAGRELAKDPAYMVSSILHGLNLHTQSSGIFGLARDIRRALAETGLETRPKPGQQEGPVGQAGNTIAGIAEGLTKPYHEVYDQLKDNWEAQRTAHRLGVTVKDLAQLGATGFKSYEHYVCFQPIQDAMVAAHWSTTHKIWNEVAPQLLKRGFSEEQVFKAIHSTSANYVNRMSGALNSYEMPVEWREKAFRSVFGQLILSPNWEMSSMRTVGNALPARAEVNSGVDAVAGAMPNAAQPAATKISSIVKSVMDKMPLSLPDPHGENLVNGTRMTPFADYARGTREMPELGEWVRNNTRRGMTAGLLGTFLGVNVLNFIMGHGFTWNNSPGDGGSLFKWMMGDHLIGAPLGQLTRFATIMGKGASLPDIIGGIYNQMGNPIKGLIDIARNQDYAGNPITSPDPEYSANNMVGRSYDALKYEASKLIPYEELMGNPRKAEDGLTMANHAIGGLRMFAPKTDSSQVARFMGVKKYMDSHMEEHIAAPLQQYYKEIAAGREESAKAYLAKARKIAVEDGIRTPAWSEINEAIAGGDRYRLDEDQFEKQMERQRVRTVGTVQEKIEAAERGVPEKAKPALRIRLDKLTRPRP